MSINQNMSPEATTIAIQLKLNESRHGLVVSVNEMDNTSMIYPSSSQQFGDQFI